MGLLSIILITIICYQSINGQSTSTLPPLVQWTDPYVGGRSGLPGADIRISHRGLDQLHSFAAETLARRIQSMNMSEVPFSVGSSQLIVEPPRFTESRFAKFEKELMPPNRIRSRFYEGRFVANGDWQYRPGTMDGTHKTTIVNAELEAVTQLAKTNDGKPIVQIVDCKANLSQFRVDITGAGSLTKIENCDDPLCVEIRQHIEGLFCQQFRLFMTEIIDTKLATYPKVIDVHLPDYKLSYALLSNEPKVNDYDLQAGLEGKGVWNGQNSVPFHPQELEFVNRSRMFAFDLSDYTFNTLLHQPHSQGYRYSATNLLSKLPMIDNILMLNCTSRCAGDAGHGGTRKALRKINRKYNRNLKLTRNINRSIAGSCMGSIFENMTNINQQQLGGVNDTGDFVYKSNSRAPSIIVHAKDRAYFDASNGVLELYGPANGLNQRQLLAKADVRSMQGNVTLSMNTLNITASINITKLELVQSSMQTRTFGDDWLIKLHDFAKPMLAEMFNAFFKRYAQFPIPMLDGLECMSPELNIAARSVQVDCDVRQHTGQAGQIRNCNSDHFYCDGHRGGRCIPWSWVCDGEFDCLDGTDEHC